MCGIIAVLRRKSRRTPPPPKILDTAVTAAIYALDQGMSATQIQAAADALIALDRELRGVPGLCTMLADEAAARHCADRLRAMQARIAAFEQLIDADEANNTDDAVEQRNAALVQLKDALWAVLMDRLLNAAAVREFAAGNAQPQAIANYASIVAALSALDRLEVRGRDSAGISVIVSGIDPNAPALRSMLQGRIEDPLFQNHSVRVTNKTIDLVYKHAAEIGELGDNTRALRSAMRGDPLLQALLRQPAAEVLVLGHTRWASVGIISQQNAHPLNNEEAGRTGPYVLGVLNGDVDNHHDLILRNDLHIAPEITTDAKVIPVLVSRQMAKGRSLADAFRHT
ncbi:MAG: glucosamine-6-phosphate synthase, partial [Planctomycetota bacterium]